MKTNILYALAVCALMVGIYWTITAVTTYRQMVQTCEAEGGFLVSAKGAWICAEGKEVRP